MASINCPSLVQEAARRGMAYLATVGGEEQVRVVSECGFGGGGGQVRAVSGCVGGGGGGVMYTAMSSFQDACVQLCVRAARRAARRACSCACV
jgi:hypothetical protein